MDGFVLGLYLLATFVGGVTTGVAGFAAGLVVSGVWLHIITPIQTAVLIVGYALLTQSYSIWKLRHALSLRRLAPFIIGGTAGAPIGVMLLTYIDPAHLRSGIGVLLVIYSVYGLARPALKPLPGGVAADVGIGFFNGLLGGLTGLGGIIVTVWCQVRGWPKDVQRAVFQPASVALLAMAGTALAATGSISRHTIELFLIGLPALAIGTWAGFALYGRLDEVTFRKIVLMLLLASGLFLLVTFR